MLGGQAMVLRNIMQLSRMVHIDYSLTFTWVCAHASLFFPTLSFVSLILDIS